MVRRKLAVGVRIVFWSHFSRHRHDAVVLNLRCAERRSGVRQNNLDNGGKHNSVSKGGGGTTTIIVKHNFANRKGQSLWKSACQEEPKREVGNH